MKTTRNRYIHIRSIYHRYDLTAEMAPSASVNNAAANRKGSPTQNPPSCNPHYNAFANMGLPITRPPYNIVVTPVNTVPMCIGSTMPVRKLLAVTEKANPRAKTACPKTRVAGEAARNMIPEPIIRQTPFIWVMRLSLTTSSNFRRWTIMYERAGMTAARTNRLTPARRDTSNDALNQIVSNSDISAFGNALPCRTSSKTSQQRIAG